MTLEELDKKLASWNTDLEAITTNLNGLEEGAGFKTAKVTELTGETKTKCLENFATVEKLWEYLKLIRDVIELAVEKRKNVPMLIGRGQAIDEIEKLLTGNSVTLPSTVVPHHERGLLADAERAHHSTPDKMKAAMVESFANVRDFFANLRTRWIELGTIASDSYKELDLLRGRVNAIGKPQPAEVTDLEHRLAAFDRNRAGNPLSLMPKKFDTEIKGYFTKARIVIQKMEHERQSLGEDVKRAYQRLEEIRGVRVTTLEAAKRASEKLLEKDVTQPPKTKELLDSLEVIKAALAAKKFAEVDSGLASWHIEANRMEALFKSMTASLDGLVNKVANLKGRMEAAKRERQANAHKGFDKDKALDKFAEVFAQADGEKFDLGAAEMALTSFETRMAGLLASWDAVPPETKLKRKLEKLAEEADALGHSDHKSLQKFKAAFEEALSAGKLDVAETMAHSYEVKLGELKLQPAPAPAPIPLPEPVAPVPSRHETLTKRLQDAKTRASQNEDAEDRVLVKFADKAELALADGKLDEAETLVYSYETRQGELAFKPRPEPVAAKSAAVVLKERLVAAQALATAHSVNPVKALTTYATKAEEALAADDLKKAEEMILSYETRVNELIAKTV